MQQILRVIAFLAMLLPGVAAAQCNSSTPLPVNTVLGRLGVVAGPCQAIPFSILLPNLGTLRTINTTAPLAGGGNLSVDRTLSLNLGVGLTTLGGNLIIANPSASTLGGVESLTCAANNWLNAISIAGVPACAQPAFTDISGQATLAQLPTLGANTTLGSVAGGTPIALSRTQQTAMLNLATTSLQGALPAWPNNTTTFFRGDGSYATLNFAALGGQGTFAQFPTGGATDTVIGYWSSTVASALAINNCTGALTYSTSTHTFGCNVTSGTGTVTSVATAGLASGGAITTTGTVTVTAAAKSDQQTATSNVLAVTPLHQQDHDSAAKAWGSFSGLTAACPGNACVPTTSYNMSSVTHTGTGLYTITFNVPFATANYSCHATNNLFAMSFNTTRTAGSATLVSTNATTPTDASLIDFVCFGRQ